MSIAMQKQIRDNSKDISSYFTDLREWTDEIGRADKNRSSAKNASTPAPPPIRGSVSIEKKKDTETVRSSVPVEVKEDEDRAKFARDKTTIKDYYKAWDSFDVDEEEKKVEKKVEETAAAAAELAQQKRTTQARPHMKVAVRSSVRAKTDEDYALAKKEEANKLFAQQRLREARDTYTKALTYLKTPSELRVTILANRAMCHLKLNSFTDTIKDTKEALDFDPAHIKARFRKAMAHSKLKQWQLAQDDLKIVVELDPTDAKAASELASATRIIKEELERRREHARKLMTFKRPFTMPLRRLQIEEVSAAKRGKEDLILAGSSTSRDLSTVTAEAIAPAPISLVTKSTEAAKTPYVPRCLRATPGSSPAGPSSTMPRSPRTTECNNPSAAESKSPVFKPPARSRPAPLMRNFYDFEHRWRSVKEREKRWELLSSVDLAKLCRESFETELLIEIMEVCEGRAEAHKVLRPLAQVRRWDITLAGLTRDERRRFDEMCECSSSSGSAAVPECSSNEHETAAVCTVSTPSAIDTSAMD